VPRDSAAQGPTRIYILPCHLNLHLGSTPLTGAERVGSFLVAERGFPQPLPVVNFLDRPRCLKELYRVVSLVEKISVSKERQRVEPEALRQSGDMGSPGCALNGPA